MLQENSFFKDQHLVRLKDYCQVQLVLMVYIVSQNTSLEPAHSFQNLHFLITHILYSTKNQLPHSFQNTTT